MNRIIIEYKDLLLNLEDSDMEVQRYQRLHNEYLKWGRDFLITKYNDNLTYVYRYLNSNTYQESLENYQYVFEKLEHKKKTLELISFFSSDFTKEDFKEVCYEQ